MMAAQTGLRYCMFSQAKYTAVIIRLFMFCVLLSCVVTLTITVLNEH